MWNVLNWGSGLQSGWPNCLSGDETGKVSNKQVTMVSFGINSIPAKFNTLNYYIGPVENGDLFIKSWDGLESTWYAPMLKWKCCHLSYAHCRVCALISHFRAVPEAGPDAYVIPNRQDSSVSPMELEYRQDSRFYRLNGTNIDENATL
jgi:hypothetical protein